MKEFLIQNWAIIVTLIIVPVLSWFGGRKHLLSSQIDQSQAQVTSTNIDNVTATLEVYKDALDDLEVRFKNRIADLESDLDRMSVLNTELRKVISGNEKFIKRLQNKLDKYEKLEG